MINHAQKRKLQKELIAEQYRLIEQLNGDKDHNISQKDAVGELSSYDNHPADMGTELYEREKDETLEAHATKQLEEINGALHAIEEGTYGLCETCSEPIPYERLAVIPEASTCVEHAEEIGVESVQIKRENDGKTMYRTADALYDIDFDENADGAVDDMDPSKEAVEDADITEGPFL